SDSKLTRNSMYSYFNELLTAGIKIYLDDDFLHSKVIIVDDEVVSVGSGNFDHRSFEQNYETNALIYDKTISEKMSKNFVEACKKCHLLSLEEHQKRPLTDKIIENFARLFSPLL
ncbi:MAG: cardiolipin synthase, partial [Flavobacteriaceae bacterium]|nr:cardiolipin synthase [Flavobacteriaceae bacterium]